MSSLRSAAGQPVLLASPASSSASARLPRCHSRSTRTCFATPVAPSSPMTATTRGPCSTTSGTRTSSTRSDTPKWRQTVQGFLERLTLGLGHLGAAASGRWQARDDLRFPLNHLGARCRIPLGDHLLNQLNAALDLLRCHRFDAIALLDLHLARHQQDKQFQKYRRVVSHHLLYRLAAAATEGKTHLVDGVGGQRMTRTLGVSAKVS